MVEETISTSRISPGPTNRLSEFRLDNKISTFFIGRVDEIRLKEDVLAKLLSLKANKKVIAVMI